MPLLSRRHLFHSVQCTTVQYISVQYRLILYTTVQGGLLQYSLQIHTNLCARGFPQWQWRLISSDSGDISGSGDTGDCSAVAVVTVVTVVQQSHWLSSHSSVAQLVGYCLTCVLLFNQTMRETQVYLYQIISELEVLPINL